MRGQRQAMPAYCRLSKAPDGSLETVRRQEADIRSWAAGSGIVVGEVFVDNNLSAWRRNVRRPDWERLMAEIEQGRHPGVLVWKMDRFTRRPRDLERLIDAADDGMVIDGPLVGHIDLGTAAGRQQARWMALQAVSESDNTSERTRNTLAYKMRGGKPMGGAGRSYGFEPGGQLVRESEAAVIREVAERFLAGDSLYRLVDDLNERGMQPVRGGHWTTFGLGRMLRRPRNAGLVEHRGEVVGRIQVDGVPLRPILELATHEDVVSRLDRRSTGERANTERVHLLSGFAVCAICRRPLQGDTIRGVQRYRCRRVRGACGSVVAHSAPVDQVVGDQLVAWLADPARTETLAKASAAYAERDEAAGRVLELEDLMVTLEARHDAGKIPDAVYERRRDALMADWRIAVADAERAAVVRPTPAVVPRQVAEDLWAGATVTERRAMVEEACTSIVVAPHPGGFRGRFDPQRVSVRLR